MTSNVNEQAAEKWVDRESPTLRVISTRAAAIMAHLAGQAIGRQEAVTLGDEMGCPECGFLMRIPASTPSAEGEKGASVLCCLGCGLPYSRFNLDSHLPRSQWLLINPDDHGVLCVECVFRRGKEKGATVAHVIFEFPLASPTPKIRTMPEEQVIEIDEEGVVHLPASTRREVTDVGGSVVSDAALALVWFVKMNAYPKESSPEFSRLTELVDRLDTVLRTHPATREQYATVRDAMKEGK